jgi:hypothetical protein
MPLFTVRDMVEVSAVLLGVICTCPRSCPELWTSMVPVGGAWPVCPVTVAETVIPAVGDVVDALAFPETLEARSPLVPFTRRFTEPEPVE